MKRPTLTPTDRSGTKNSSTGGVNGMVQRDVTADPPGEGKISGRGTPKFIDPFTFPPPLNSARQPKRVSSGRCGDWASRASEGRVDAG